MQLPSTPRRGHARAKPVHFTYVNTERGQPWEGYLAGPIWWGHVHMMRPSKPCVYELTEGKLSCRFCNGKSVPVVKGWVPIYRRIDGQAVCVPVDEVLRDALDPLKCFSKVNVGRAKGKGASVWVQACLNQEPVWESTLPERNEPADISQSLLNMWALPEVTQFFCGTHADVVTHALKGEEVGERVVEKVESELRKQAENSKRTGDNALTLADALREHKRFGHMTNSPKPNGRQE